MPLVIEDTDVPIIRRFLSQVFGIPIADAAAEHAATRALIHQLIQQVQTMSDNVNAKLDAQDAKIDQLVTSVGSLEQRIAAQDGKLTAVQTERDAAVADLATTKQALADAKAQLAAIPQVDTTALEARLQAEADKVDGVINRLNAIDAAPVPASTPPASDGSQSSTGSAADTATPDGNTGMPKGTVTEL